MKTGLAPVPASSKVNQLYDRVSRRAKNSGDDADNPNLYTVDSTVDPAQFQDA